MHQIQVKIQASASTLDLLSHCDETQRGGWCELSGRGVIIFLMKVWIIIGTKLVAIWLLVWLLNDPTQQTKALTAEPVCLQSDATNKLCAQCYKRDNSVLPGKGYRVASQSLSSVLKLTEPVHYLTCEQYLQLINFQKDASLGQAFHLETLLPIQQVVSQIGGSFSSKGQTYNQSEYIVEPWFNQFVVYKWMSTTPAPPLESSVTTINSDYYAQVHGYLLLGFNFVLLVVLVAWLADSSFIRELSTSVKTTLVCILICIELSLFGVMSEGTLLIGRIMVLNLGLLKMKVNNFKVMAFMAVGAILGYFPFTLLIYTGLMTILVAYYGKDQSQTKSVKLLLVIFNTVLLLNYSYWYQYALYLNDIPCKIIEYSVLTFIPTGIFLLPNRKTFFPYIPTDPEITSIRLHGFDEDEEHHI